MPNTNPSDLDRDDWVASVFVSNHGVDMDLEAHIACKLPDGAHKLYAHPVLPASGVPEAEAVAWRYKPRSGGEWEYFTGPWREPWNEKWIGEPLYAAPPPVAAPSGEAGELLPCPFCGNKPETHYHYDGMDIYGVNCGGHAGFDGETLKEAADKWNTRTTPSGAKP